MANQKKRKAKQSKINKFKQKMAAKVLKRKNSKVAMAVKSHVVRHIQAQETSKQYDYLNASLDTGRLKPEKLKKTFMGKAPKEMRKGAVTLHKSGKKVTVDGLMAEIRGDKGLLNLLKRIDLPVKYFEELAQVECERWVDNGTGK